MITAASRRATKRFRLFNGIHRVIIIDEKDALFEAYLEFAFFHTLHDAVRYERIAAGSHSHEWKYLFAQLACRKREVLQTLKRNRSEFVSLDFAHREKNETVLAEKEVPPQDQKSAFSTEKQVFEYIYERENRTLDLYRKMADGIRLPSVRVLFNYLIESQRGHMRFCDSRLACVNERFDIPTAETTEPEKSWTA